MATIRIVRTDDFSFDDLTIEPVAKSSWQPPEQLKQQLETEREERLASYRAAWIPAHNGLWYRLENLDHLEAGGNTLQLSTVEHGYVDTLKQHPHLLEERTLRLNNLSTGCLVKTVDNWWVFGVRKKNDSFAIIGGWVQKDQLEITTGEDLTRNLYKEIHEEIWIDQAAIKDRKELGIVQSWTSCIVFVSQVTLSLTRKQVQECFQQRTDQELKRLERVTAEELPEFLLAWDSYKPLLAELI